MKSLNERLKELLDPRPSEQGWCDTTRLAANPWSVLLGGLRRREEDHSARAEGMPPDDRVRDAGAGVAHAPDLRRVGEPPPGKDGR